MELIEQDIAGIDGTSARFTGYVIGNTPSIDEGRRRPAVLILPGGGYSRTSDREAEPIALRLVGMGYHAFTLRYSCAPSVYPVSTLEAAEAVRTIRSHADEWHIDPDAVVVGGFSAGGHAAALFAESWDTALMDEHGFPREEVRPNGLMLAYPVITAGRHAHLGSISNILGPGREDDPVWRDRMSLERHVPPSMPPAFIWTTATDQSVPAQNSLLFASALAEAGVPYELHIFREGAHGSALANGETKHRETDIVPCAQVWPELFDTWMLGQFPGALSWRLD